MARKKDVNGSSAISGGSNVEPVQGDTNTTTKVEEMSSSETAKPIVYEPVQINNYDVKELKNTLDDALKRCLSRPGFFNQNHLHTDIRLALGWTSILVAGATGLYSWKISFEESKTGVAAGVFLYMLLSAVQMAYIYFVEGSTVFVGKRKTLAKRIETERLTAASSTTRPKPRSATPASAPTLSLSTAYPRSTSSYLPPHYKVSMQFIVTASSGKSMIRKTKVEDERCYADFFDAKGVLDEARFATWLSAMVAKVEAEN